MARPLTDKQKLFVQEYLVDLNATKAALRAGYSPKTAKDQGPQLLRKTHIQDEIARQMAIRSRKCGINAERTLQELGRLAFFNPTDVIDFSTGKIRDDAEPEDLRVIVKHKHKSTSHTRKDGTKEVFEESEVVFIDRVRVMQLLLQHLGLAQPKQEIQVAEGAGVVILPARQELPPPPDQEQEKDD